MEVNKLQGHCEMVCVGEDVFSWSTINTLPVYSGGSRNTTSIHSTLVLLLDDARIHR